MYSQVNRKTDHTASRSLAPRSLLAAIDQGTTSSRCILFDHDGRPAASHQLEHEQITPRPGWVEHDAEEILDRVRACIRGAMAQIGADARALAAVGISNQRETTVVWSRSTGRPIANAIVWQDTRTADARARLAAGDPAGIDRFRAMTGLPISTYSSALTLAWILDHGKPDATRERRAEAARSDLLFGTIDTWLIWQLTGGRDGGVHVTDGTGAFMLMHTGDRPVPSRHGLITTVAARLGRGPTTYALEGSVAVTGSLIGWLRDNLGIIGDAREVEALARSVPDSGDVVFVPRVLRAVRASLAKRRPRRHRRPYCLRHARPHRARSHRGHGLPGV